MSPVEIGTIGEHYAEEFLHSQGFACNCSALLPAAAVIEAAAAKKSAIVHVKTGLHPNKAPALSADEHTNLVAQAFRKHGEAWLAQLEIDLEGKPLGVIRWTQLC